MKILKHAPKPEATKKLKSAIPWLKWAFQQKCGFAAKAQNAQEDFAICYQIPATQRHQTLKKYC